MTDYMITGLVRKRGELAGEIHATHDRLGQLVRDLEAVDRALAVVAPNMEIEAIRPKMFRPPEDWANRGQMSRLVLMILRQARELPHPADPGVHTRRATVHEHDGWPLALFNVVSVDAIDINLLAVHGDGPSPV